MGTPTGNQSNGISNDLYIDSRCVVEFRPNDDWKGEYGFDWYRIGDVKESINGKSTASKYADIVGKYYPDDRDPDCDGKAGEFKTIIGTTNYARKLADDEYTAGEYSYTEILVKDASPYPYYYLVPSISLYFSSQDKESLILPNAMSYERNGKRYQQSFCKSEVTVKVLIDANNIDRIEFACHDSLTVTQKELSGIRNGKSEKTITIRFNYYFPDKYMPIKAFAHHKNGETTFAGQINVVKCDPKNIDICFVNVQLKINKTYSHGFPNPNFVDQQKNYLNRFLSQAHIIPHYFTISLDIDLEANPSNAFSDFVIDGIDETGKKTGKIYISTMIKKSIGDICVYYSIHSCLEDLLDSKLANIKDSARSSNVKNSYKVFFLEETNGEYGMVSSKLVPNTLVYGVEKKCDGMAKGIPSKSAVVFRDPTNDIVCHELLHCLGLYHSFSNKGKHTFKQFMTNNIMDYVEDYKFERYTLWRWQWEKIRSGGNLNNIL